MAGSESNGRQTRSTAATAIAATTAITIVQDLPDTVLSRSP